MKVSIDVRLVGRPYDNYNAASPAAYQNNDSLAAPPLLECSVTLAIY